MKCDLSRKDIVYQATFDTRQNEWITIDLPFHSFIPVQRTNVDYAAPLLSGYCSLDSSGEKISDPSNLKTEGYVPKTSATLSSAVIVSSIGFLLSKFEFNGDMNPTRPDGAFRIDVADVSLYRSPRPEIVLLSSAGTERINRLSEEQIKNDIPIVQLNPQVDVACQSVFRG
jgi:Complex I intermediate-associated protein 30 (CIA30)